MSHSLRPAVRRRLARVAGAAVVVSLAGCGGTGDGPATPAPGNATATSTAAASDAVGFCARAAVIDQRVDAAVAGADGGDPSIVVAFHALAAELRGIDAPDPITTAWVEMSAGLDRMADAFADLDITDPDSLDALDRAEGSLTAAGNQVESYLHHECGL